MAKRYVDTDMWKKKWFRTLSAKMKNVWIYLITMCDHAGLYEVDVDLMGLFIGEEITEDEIMERLGNQIQVINEDKWFLPKFVKFQYNVTDPTELNPNNRVHKSVIDILSSYNLVQGSSKTLTSPLEKDIRVTRGAKDKDKDKDIDKDKDKFKDKDINRTKRKVFKMPTEDEVREYCKKRNNSIQAGSFMAHYISKGWMIGKNKMVDWKAAVRTWEKNNFNQNTNNKVFVEPEHREVKRGW
tara:strand:+ start:120 stop:842 length:723 start_codon:yes stop_codon:yes gene_type:complete